MSKSKTEEPKVEAAPVAAADPGQDGAGVAELVTPTEHAATTDSLDAGQNVSDPGVPNDVEVAARSADMEEPSLEHEKVFVLGPGVAGVKGNPYTEAAGYDHEPNKAATRQYAIDVGLWPTGDVRFKSGKRHPDGESWILSYAVPVIPASDALDGLPTPSVVADDGDATGATNYAEPTGEGEPTA